MNFKAFTGGGGGGDSSTSFAAARALFEAAKKPENRALATAAAKNPVIRNAAISAAQNPQTRQAMVSAASTYTANQNNASSTSVLRPEPAPKPPVKDYGSSASSYGSSVPARPAPSIGTTKPVYPDLMSELKALNIGRDNEPAPSYSKTSSLPPASGWSAQLTYTPPQPVYHQPAPPPQPQKQEWTKFSQDAPARPPPPKNLPLSPKSTSPTSEAYAVVKYPHAGSHFDELSCVAGDRIVLKREVDEQWIYGLNQRTGKFGIVPIAFLDVRVPLAPSPTLAQKRADPSANMATALYDYTSQEPGDLTFSAGSSIRILERVGTDWLSGELHGRRGIFPAAFVDCPSLASVPLQAPAAPSHYGSPSGGYGSPQGTVTATFDYNSGVDGDLVFYAGEVIDVLERLPDGEWLRGRLRGSTGLVPMTYVTASSSTVPSTMTSSGPSTPSTATGKTVRFPPGTPCNPPVTVTATADYHTGEADCLYFSRGDQILITEYVNNEWAKGKPAEFKTLPAGYFPRSYVQ